MSTLISDTLQAEVIATSKVTFLDRSIREQDDKGFEGGPVSLDKTRFRSQGGMGSLTWGYSLFRPLINLVVMLWEKTDLPWIRG